MRKISLILILLLAISTLCSCGSNDIQNINVEPSKTMTVGDSLKLNFTIQPENASRKGIVWSSSNDTVASVNDGTIRANKAGEADITVSASNSVSASCHIKVNDIDITKIIISPSNTQIKRDNTVTLGAKVYPSTASDVDLEWISSNDYIASVDSGGTVSGLHKGTATISCVAPNGKSASCTIKVTGKKKKSTNNIINNNYYLNDRNNTKRKITEYYALNEDLIFPDSSSRYLNESEVASLNDSILVQKAINEIYARNGNIFSTTYIQKYFEQFYWYVGISKNVSPKSFNKYESHNFSLLKKYK